MCGDLIQTQNSNYRWALGDGGTGLDTAERQTQVHTASRTSGESPLRRLRSQSGTQKKKEKKKRKESPIGPT